jgi:hypothetical protein
MTTEAASAAASALPPWAQVIFYAGSAIGLAIAIFRQYSKGGGGSSSEAGQKDESKGTMIAGAVFDTATMRGLRDEITRLEATVSRVDQTIDRAEVTIDRTERSARDSERQHCACMEENTQEVKALRRAVIALKQQMLGRDE